MLTREVATGGGGWKWDCGRGDFRVGRGGDDIFWNIGGGKCGFLERGDGFPG
jgi:hypothetical protein